MDTPIESLKQIWETVEPYSPIVFFALLAFLLILMLFDNWYLTR
ncbi:MAG: hypothetical protein ACE5JP_08050 [Candidatus Bipolaricaulia bacterium]